MQDDRLQNGQSIIHPSIRFDFTLTPADLIFYFESVNKSQTGAKKKNQPRMFCFFFLASNKRTEQQVRKQPNRLEAFSPPPGTTGSLCLETRQKHLLLKICVWAAAERGHVTRSTKAEFGPYVHRTKLIARLQATPTMQTNTLQTMVIISSLAVNECNSCATAQCTPAPSQSGGANEDIAERYERADQRSQRKVNEAAEVTLSSMLLIAVFEDRAGNADV